MLRRLPLIALAALAVALPASDAPAAGKTCKSADLRYPFQPGGPKTFGVFRLRITGGSCATAHRIAKAWMQEFEASLRGTGKLRLPKSVGGFTFKTLKPTAAQ